MAPNLCPIETPFRRFPMRSVQTKHVVIVGVGGSWLLVGEDFPSALEQAR